MPTAVLLRIIFHNVRELMGPTWQHAVTLANNLKREERKDKTLNQILDGLQYQATTEPVKGFDDSHNDDDEKKKLQKRPTLRAAPG